MKYGMIPELIGRIPIITALDELDLNTLIKILNEPKNALTKQYKALFKIDGVDLVFEDKALEQIAKLTMNRGLGARGLRGIMENIMMPIMYTIPSSDDIKKFTVDKKLVDKSIKDILDNKNAS
jgi:ATP-dependent Clp protease ATP-binding subunit ClpX